MRIVVGRVLKTGILNPLANAAWRINTSLRCPFRSHSGRREHDEQVGKQGDGNQSRQRGAGVCREIAGDVTFQVVILVEDSLFWSTAQFFQRVFFVGFLFMTDNLMFTCGNRPCHVPLHQERQG